MGMLNCLLKNGEKGFFVVLCLLLVLLMEMTSIDASRSNSSYNKLQIDAKLKLLNKPAVKSIKSPDGDIIDCIKITDQPAFDNPLLRNHTIQMAPSFYPEGVVRQNEANSYNKKGTKTQLWQLNGSCPKGTIPVRRTKEEDLLRASSIQDFGKKKYRSIPQPRSANPELVSTGNGHEYGIAYVKGSKYYGTNATFNVWKPRVEQSNEFSLGQLWVVGGSSADDRNTIEVGWQVSPSQYGDNNPRLFTFWTGDGYQDTGCYNLLCAGFVQTSNEMALGGTIHPFSTYQGTQYIVNLLVWKDPTDGNWWLQFRNKYVLGYFPTTLFNYLKDSADMVQWGGEVVNSEANGQHTSTEMGSGHFPQEGYGKASFVKNLKIVDGSNILREPNGITAFADRSGCYDVKLGKSRDWGNYFYYGGPGRRQSCP